ncbi:MAG: serine/threonine-protein kinase [Pseudomonadota bacterium]
MTNDKTFDADNESATLVKPKATIANETMVNPQSPDKTKVKIRTNDSVTRDTDREVGIGDIVKDRFVLDRVLGTGGMGAVFRALDLRKKEAGDNRPYVALKILGADFKNHPDALVTLQREARKTQDLASPNIVTVYDFDRDGDLVYLTMEELQGRSLAEVLLDKSIVLSFDEKIVMIRQIAQGLAYAHSKGLVHSDLKPANVFVTGTNQIKILDFGIARASHSNIYEDSFDAGQLGAITAAYASLEMLRHEPPHPSDDIYALGIIAGELFNGKHPYGRKDAQHAFTNKLKPVLPHYRNPWLNKLFLQSVALQRTQRIMDGDKFLKQLRFALSTPKRLTTAAAIICILLIANFIYLQQVTPTIIKLKELPVAAQTNFHNYIREAELALSFNDLQGAVFNIDQAFKIHQTDKSLITVRDKILQISTDNLTKAESEADKNFYTEQLAQLKAYPAFAKKDSTGAEASSLSH